MSGAKQDQLEIRPFWPTLMLRHRLPGAERANPVLARAGAGAKGAAWALGPESGCHQLP